MFLSAKKPVEVGVASLALEMKSRYSQPSKKPSPSVTLQTSPFVDNFYLNLIGMNNKGILAIASEGKIHLYNVATKKYLLDLLLASTRI